MEANTVATTAQRKLHAEHSSTRQTARIPTLAGGAPFRRPPRARLLARRAERARGRAPPRRDGPQRAEREAAAHAGADGARAADRPHDPHPPRGGRAVGASAGMGRSRHHLRHRGGERGHRHRAGAQGAVLARSAKIDERARGARRPRRHGDGGARARPRAGRPRAAGRRQHGARRPATRRGGRAAHAGSRAHGRVGARREGRLRRGSARRAAGRPVEHGVRHRHRHRGTRGGHRGGHGHGNRGRAHRRHAGRRRGAGHAHQAQAGLVRQDPHHRGRSGGAGRACRRPGLRPPVRSLAAAGRVAGHLGDPREPARHRHHHHGAGRAAHGPPRGARAPSPRTA